VKILYADPYSDTPYSKIYLYYEGLYHALKKKHEVFLYRDCFTDYNDIKNVIPFVPDIILFGLSWFEKHKYFEKIKNLEMFKVCYLFKPSVDLERKKYFCKVNEIDLIVTPHSFLNELNKILSIKTVLFPYGFDPNIFYPRNSGKVYDFGFSGALHNNSHYPSDAFTNPNIREKVYHILNKMGNLNYFWKSTDKFETARIHDNIRYAKTMSKSRVWMGTQAAYGDITPRYFEVMGTGSLLYCEENTLEYKEIFNNHVNCLEFDNSLKNFSRKLNEILEDKDKLLEIANQGCKEAHDKHSWDKRSDQLTQLMNS
tara:strand:- start:237 stop:1175 length:939 start_codon:yes stop_codon:yes gene_type:complete